MRMKCCGVARMPVSSHSSFGGLHQRFIGFEVARRLVPQRFAVDGFFNDQKFIFRVNHAGDGDMRFKHTSLPL
jgi:hypothetical protein